MPTQAEIDKENDWQLAEWNRNAIESTKPQSAPIPPTMLTVATEAIQRQQYTSPLVSRNLADAALVAAGYGDLVDALENSLALNVNWSVEASPSDLAHYSEYKIVIQQAEAVLARVHGEASEGKQ
jgi:hypothetical protein